MENATKNEAIENAKKCLQTRLDKHSRALVQIRELVNQFESCANENLKVEWTKKHLFEIPGAFINVPGSDESIYWKGDSVSAEVDWVKVTYRGYLIQFQFTYESRRSWTGNKPYEMMKMYVLYPDLMHVNDGRCYMHPKTVLKKIDEDFEERQRRLEFKKLEEAALKTATEYVKSVVPSDAEVIPNKNDWKFYENHFRKGSGYSFMSITVRFKNSNVVKYCVTPCDDEPGYCLSVVDVIDVAYINKMKELKKNPKSMLDYLS